MSNELDTLKAFSARWKSLPAQRVGLIKAAREAGATWPQIAEAMGVTVRGARAASEATARKGRPTK